jgi:hypothetical protein
MTVVYDASAILGARAAGPVAHAPYVGRLEFRRLERLVILAGGVALGLSLGFTTAIGVGRPSLTALIASGAVLVAFGLYLSSQTLRECLLKRAPGCAAATIAQAAALLAWPLTGLFAPVSAPVFWAAPALAISALVLFASCWNGPSRAVYRLGLQGALVAALAAYQGALVIMSG